MTKQSMHVLALALFTAPLILAGCGSGDGNSGTGGSGGGGGSTVTGQADASGGGTGGARMDAGGAPDLSSLPVDTARTDTAIPDVPTVIDTTQIDAPTPIDIAAPVDIAAPIDIAAPVDIAAPIDTTPAVCTIKPAFTGGAVNSSLTLTKACSPYTITDDISVNGNATLTIEAGATLRFDPDVGIGIGYSTAAKLVAVGTATNPITFTSSNATPSAGDWVGIVLWSGTMGGTQIAYANLDYCGSSYSCIQGSGVKPARVTIDHVAISHVGAGHNGIEEDDADSTFTISNSTFSNIPTTPTQQYAISVQAPSFAGIDSTNTFNGGAMIELAGGTVSVSTDWKNPGATVAVTSALSLGGTTTPILTIAAGSVFKFAADTYLWVGYSYAGNLKVNGTLAANVVFTSLNTSPAPGDWAGITLWGSGRATIQYANISYGGGSSAGDVTVKSDTNVLDIENSKLTNSAGYAISIPCGSAATVTNTGNTFASNASGNVGPGPAATGTLACP